MLSKGPDASYFIAVLLTGLVELNLGRGCGPKVRVSLLSSSGRPRVDNGSCEEQSEAMLVKLVVAASSAHAVAVLTVLLTIFVTCLDRSL